MSVAIHLLLFVQAAASAIPGPPANARLWTLSDFATDTAQQDREVYPASALRAGEQGRARVGVRVGRSGRAITCWIMESSGSAALDRASCKQVLRNARFKPATDASGQIIEDNVSVPLNWVLPE